MVDGPRRQTGKVWMRCWAISNRLQQRPGNNVGRIFEIFWQKSFEDYRWQYQLTRRERPELGWTNNRRTAGIHRGVCSRWSYEIPKTFHPQPMVNWPFLYNSLLQRCLCAQSIHINFVPPTLWRHSYAISTGQRHRRQASSRAGLLGNLASKLHAVLQSVSNSNGWRASPLLPREVLREGVHGLKTGQIWHQILDYLRFSELVRVQFPDLLPR